MEIIEESVEWLRRTKSKPKVRNTETQNKPKVARISIEDVNKHVAEFVFVNARSLTARSRNSLQVPVAPHVPAEELDRALKNLPKKGTIVN